MTSTSEHWCIGLFFQYLINTRHPVNHFPRIGLIGLIGSGARGLAMARNLHQRG